MTDRASRTPLSLARGCLPLAILLVVGGCGRLLAPPTAGVGTVPSPASAQAPTRPPVGIASRVFTDPVRGRELMTTIWYPAAAGSVEDDIEWNGIFIGRGAWNAPLRTAPRRLPLVLLSHGSGADASNLTWLAEALASRGYLAVAMDHPGDRFGDVSIEGTFAVWRRPPDLSVVLDRVLADATFGPRVDRGRIAAAGHSSGAHAVLALAGLRIQPSAFLKYCAGPLAGPDCERFADLDLGRIPDLADGGRSGRDRRIRAVLAFAPVLGPAAIPASLRSVTVPVMIVGSPSDEMIPFDLNGARYLRFVRRARLIAILDAGHFVFMPVCTLPGRIVAAQVCVDRGEGTDRAAVHARIAEAALRFFDRSLRVPPQSKRYK